MKASAAVLLAACALVIDLHASQHAGGLKIVAVAGEDAVNIIQQKTATAPIVEVRDRNDQPVAGAVVNFVIRGGRATFSGARTISVATDVAGRAVATGFTPTASGAVQISASAAFQGESAAITITQTNVLTAAQAAAASSASGGGSGTAATSGAAGGAGGGGLSATTLAIVGGAVAGGAIVAKETLGGPGGTVYTGQFSGQIVVTGPAPFCGFTNPVSGTLVIRLEDPAASSLTGSAEVDEEIGVVYNPSCNLGPQPSIRAQSDPAPISGSGSNMTFQFQHETPFTNPAGSAAGTGIHTWSLSFTGALKGTEITGVLTQTEANRSTSGLPLSGSGTTAFPITLRQGS